MHVMTHTNHKTTGAVMLVFTLAFCLFMLPMQSNAGDKPEHVSQVISKPEVRDHDRHERAAKSARRLLNAHERGEDITPQLAVLDADSAEIEKEEQEHLKRFEQTGKKLRSIKGISTVVSRHEQALQQFRQKSGELKEHFHNIRRAKSNKSVPAEITGRVKELNDYLEKHRPRKEFDIKSTDSGLPWRMVQPGDLQILGDISQASQQGTLPAAAPPASANDLSATIDVQITPEIRALAASLNNSPLEIFRHVYNNYDYTPYHGSMKGSLDTFWEKEGNDYDLASLLIALLRASNVSARYVRAEIIVPIRNIQAWLGIDDPMAAAQYLAGAKIPCSFYTSGSSISHVKLEHIYVEAFIPYGNYRGTIEDDKGKAWVPMDPSFKKYAVTQSGIDFGTAMAFDWKSFSSDYLGNLQNITPLSHYNNRINDYIAATYPDKTIDDLKRKAELTHMKFDFFPNTLPYKTYNIIERYSAIPSTQRHSVSFTMPGVLDYSTTLPEISGRRITLTFTGATAEDQTAIDSYGGIFKTPPYLIKVVPILRIGGTQVAQGSAQDAGTMTPFSVTHSHPDGKQDPFNHNVITGSHNAIGLTTGKVRPEFLSIAEVEPSDEVYLPKMLHSLVMKYHNSLSETRRTLNDTMRMQSRTFLTEALVSTSEERTLVLGGIPTTFTLEGFKIDAKEVSMAALPVDGKDINKKQIDFAMTFGHEASYQENRVFEDSMFWVQGTSAVKGLQMLNAFGIQLDEPEPHTTYANTNLPTGVVEDINNALNMGWRVIVPQETGGLQAVPYIKYDEKTGSAGFMIAAAAGGLANETMDLTWLKDSWLKNNISYNVQFKMPESPYLVAMGDTIQVIIRTTAKVLGGLEMSEADAAEYIRTDKNYFISKKQGIPLWALLTGKYKFKFDQRTVFEFNVWKGVFIKEVITPCTSYTGLNPCKDSFVANVSGTGDMISVSAVAQQDGSDYSNNIAWTCFGTLQSGKSGICNPKTGNGRSLSFVPKPLSHSSYLNGTNCSNAGNGSCMKSVPFSYEVEAKYQSNAARATITQDEIDTIIQEYHNHGISAPSRQDFTIPMSTANFTAAQISNNNAYLFVLGTPGELAQAVRNAYNNQLKESDQTIPSYDLRINSTWRNPERNEAVGGVKNSRHQYGNANDLSVILPVSGKSRSALYCILEQAANSISGVTAFTEHNGERRFDCSDADVTHVHVQK